jgi:ribosomal protein S18 acetylase RimI-like enzyme
MVIRHFRWRDLDQFVDMQNVLHGEQVMANHQETDRPRGAEMLSRKLVREESGRHSELLVEADGRIVGCGDIAPHSGYQTCCLGITLIGEYTGRGIGKRFMSVLEGEADRLGYARIMLTVWGVNDPAYRLYVKTGFREIGRFPDWIRTDRSPSRFSDLVWMVKDLHPLTP